jgi:hypothetical protein
MTLDHDPPAPVRVSWDARNHRPRDVRIGSRQMRVTALDAVREESAAYRADRGPRVTFLVETDQGPASLVFDLRRRRWSVEVSEQAA